MGAAANSQPALLRARALIADGDWGAARAALAGADREYERTHDGMRNLNVRMQEAVYAHFGRDGGDRIADRVYQRMTDWAFAATDEPGFREQVETFAMLWQWHRTPVRIVEDAEKVTYIMAPCGSGGRLISAGAYLPSAARPLTVLDEPSFASFSEANFPNWCAHCAFSNRGYLTRGIATFLLEGWSDHRRWGGCAAHSYKHVGLVPDEAFERVGLEPRGGDAPAVPARVFTDAELAELARPVLERILEALEHRDATRAVDLIDRSWAAWRNLHDAYRCWYAMFVDQLALEDGPELAWRLVEQTAWEVVAPVLEDPAPGADAWEHLWRNHCGLAAVDTAADGRARALAVSRDALVHPELEPEAADALAARLAAAIAGGVERAGHAAAFGTLRYAGGRFEHLLPEL